MPIKIRAVQIWEFCAHEPVGGIAGLLPGSARPVQEAGEDQRAIHAKDVGTVSAVQEPPRPACPGTLQRSRDAAYRRDISHSCRSPASAARCSGSIAPAVLSAPNTGLRQPHEQTAWTPPSPTSWMVVWWSTAIGVLTGE